MSCCRIVYWMCLSACNNSLPVAKPKFNKIRKQVYLLLIIQANYQNTSSPEHVENLNDDEKYLDSFELDLFCSMSTCSFRLVLIRLIMSAQMFFIYSNPIFRQCINSKAMKPAHTQFRDQVSTLVNWFLNWNECEQTIALYTLLKRISNTQARFLSLILEHTFRDDPVEIQILQKQANDKGSASRSWQVGGWVSQHSVTFIGHMVLFSSKQAFYYHLHSNKTKPPDIRHLRIYQDPVFFSFRHMHSAFVQNPLYIFFLFVPFSFSTIVV